MSSRSYPILLAFAACILVAAPAHSQSPAAGTDPRPKEATQLPSDTGAQTTQPSGAVTGAGQPQGTLPQPPEGSPGGVEEKARREARPQDATEAPNEPRRTEPKKR